MLYVVDGRGPGGGGWRLTSSRRGRYGWSIPKRRRESRASCITMRWRRLCVFGWIDSIIKKLDSLRAVQRFTPRNPKSGYSQQNKERLHWLAEEGLLHPSVRESVEDVLNEEYVFPPDILEAIRANGEAWKHFPGLFAGFTGGSGWHTSTPQGCARRCSQADWRT